jgi:MAF protein
MQKLVLGSTSPFRRELLARLGLDFITDRPEVDESRGEGEEADALVRRLSLAKAQAVARRHPGALVIGSDQVASLDGRILGKPGSFDGAVDQLSAMSGRSVTFHTGLCLLNAANDRVQLTVEHYRVDFRSLDEEQICRYVLREQPYDCAGSFKSEGYGIVLFRAMEGRDPNSLVGLPLMALVDMLAAEGVALP